MSEPSGLEANIRPERENYTSDNGAYSTQRTQSAEGPAEFIQTEVGTQPTISSSAESEEKPLEIKDSSTTVRVSDSSGSEGSSIAAKPAHPKLITQDLEAPAAESDLTPLEKFLADPMPSMYVGTAASAELAGRRIDSMYVWPPTPGTDSTAFDSEPSPLSLSGRPTSSYSKAQPGRGLLSSISELESSDFDRIKTNSPPPHFAENTPELSQVRLVAQSGSPIHMPNTTKPDITLLDLDILPSPQAVRIFDLSRRRSRSSLLGWSESSTGEVVRCDTPGLSVLDFHVRTAQNRAASPICQLQTEEHSMLLLSWGQDQSTQTSPVDDPTPAAKSTGGIERTTTCFSMACWLLCLCMALGSWFRADDKQLWLQANEMTRQRVLALGGQGWAQPSWLARISFDAENMLDIDRSRFA